MRFKLLRVCGVVPMVGALSIGGLAGSGALAMGTAGATADAAHKAHAARTLSLNETGRLRLTSSHGLTLNEKGSASGTIRGSIYIHLKISSTNRVTAQVNIYPNNGSLTGSGSAAYRVAGSYATFSGSLAVTRGTGSYARAHASNLSFTGTIQRRTDAVTVRLSGPLSV
jgi:hypothetical protein